MLTQNRGLGKHNVAREPFPPPGEGGFTGRILSIGTGGDIIRCALEREGAEGMNRKIGMYSSAVNLTAVLCFAISMPLGSAGGSYFASMCIAFSFVPMMCAYACFAEERDRLAGCVSAAFAAMYATVILLVYFAQLTTVRLNELTPQAGALLDFQRFGLMFNYDLLGYALMALATFFAGLTIHARTRADRWLKRLLMVHGVFFVSCLLLPMLGVFREGGPAWTGVAALEFWCLYFCPISLLSCWRFAKQPV